MKRVHVQRHMRGLWFRNGDYQGFLEPGFHWLWRPLADEVDQIDARNGRFEHPMMDILLEDARLREELVIVELNDGQRGIVWQNGRLLEIVGPGRHIWWKAPARYEVEVFDTDAVRFDHDRIEAILALPGAATWLQGVDVEPHEDVFLFRSGQLLERLAPGRHVFWKGVGSIKWKAFDLRETTTDISGQEIMTRDKVTLRLNLLVTWKITDPELLLGVVDQYRELVYREAQLALRSAIGALSLDDLLADKEKIGLEIVDALAPRAGELGISIRSVGIRDIILPGDMKEIMNRVITAEKEAQANLIRRREETAAARSQANTARLLAENPALARMKELEFLQGILAETKSTFVFGSSDIAREIRGLIPASGTTEGADRA